jgi:hypothetical protein
MLETLEFAVPLTLRLETQLIISRLAYKLRTAIEIEISRRPDVQGTGFNDLGPA